jgi:DNA-binding LytR/AlgR family response regulator
MNIEGQYECLIVDDNKVARVLLSQLIEQIPSLKIIGECGGAIEAATLLAKTKVDLLFLDIEMPDMNGFELLRSLQDRPVTILTSGNKGYAEEAYTLNVADYIVKPIELPRLMMAVQRATELINRVDTELKNVESDYVFIKENKVLRKLLIDDIYFFESKGDYVKIQVANKYYIVHSTLKQLDNRLSTSKFLRVHRSYIVAINKIDYIEENIIYLNNIPVPVSESCRNDLLKALNFL